MSLRAAIRRALDAGRPERAWDLAAGAYERGDSRVRYDARRLLKYIVRQLPRAAWTPERAGCAAEIGLGLRPLDGSRVGVVAFPAVGLGGGRFVAVTAARSDGDDLPEWLDDRSAAQVRDALDAARTVLGERSSWTITFDAEGWGGASCGLAVALAAISAARDEPHPAGVVATGGVRADARVVHVGRAPEKRRLHREARPMARMLVPREWEGVRPAELPVGTVAEALERFGAGGAAIDQRLREVRDADRGGDWVRAARLAEEVWERAGAGELEEGERIMLIGALLAAANHGVDEPARRRWEAELASLLSSDQSDDLMARALGSRIVIAVDRLDLTGAGEALALARARPWGSVARMHIDGSAALVATLSGDHERALALRRENLVRARRSAKTELARCLGDLSDALLRTGQPERALEAADCALATDVGRRRGYLRRTRCYLTLHRARALLALGRGAEALRALDASARLPGPDPELRLRLLRARILGDGALVEGVWEELAGDHRADVLLGALISRTRFQLGDARAGRELVALPVFSGLEPREAARRLPY